MPQFDLPLFFDTEDLLVIVVGGGPVGLRKTRWLLDAGASVRVVALEPPPEQFRDTARLDWRTEAYRPEHLNGARIVFTAAPFDVCQRVQVDSRTRGLFVCRADTFKEGDFITPLTLRRGERFRIAITTGGASPLLARRVRDRLAELFDEPFGRWVDLLETWRIRAAASDWPSADARRSFLEQISTWAWLDHFRAEGLEAVSMAYAELAGKLGLRGPIV
jgi:siroheme synthase-like protein